MPLLLDEEPFVRFCAAESLRRLTGREPTVDWIGASAEERARAAPALRAQARAGAVCRRHVEPDVLRYP
jgi:hypothetical protein